MKKLVRFRSLLIAFSIIALVSLALRISYNAGTANPQGLMDGWDRYLSGPILLSIWAYWAKSVTVGRRELPKDSKPPSAIRCSVPLDFKGSCQLSYEIDGVQHTFDFDSPEKAMSFTHWAVQVRRDWANVTISKKADEVRVV
jgi:hypothetical protein